jgi:hypothetical protein
MLVFGTVAAGGTTVSKPPAPGHWTKLGTVHGGPATLWRGPDDRDWVVWQTNGGTYELAILSSGGGISKAPATALHWSSVSSDPTLLSNGKQPLVVFSGQNPGKYGLGCIVGAVPGTPWTPQTWSLSQNCTAAESYGGAAVNAKGAISAAWSAVGGGVEYRIGVSKSIPASTPDNKLLIGLGYEAFESEAVDTTGTGHFYVAFDRYFSKPASADGLWVKDLTANGPLMRAPGSGTPTVTGLLENVPFTNSTSKRGGVYLAYCANTDSCSHVLLWRVGSKHPLVVPDSAGARFVAIASGHDGRLWLVWYNANTSVLYTVRTNEADSRFGPVESYAVNWGGKPLIEANTMSVGGGNFGRIDVVVCGVDNSFGSVVLTTQSLAGLALSPRRTSIKNTKASTVTFRVTDAGDPVVGASVTVDGHTAKTGAEGGAKFTFPKGAATGTFKVTATAKNYFSATAKVVVKT